MNLTVKISHLTNPTISIGLAVILCLVFVACGLPLDTMDGGEDSDHYTAADSGGCALSVTITSIGVKTLLPDIDMSPAAYTVSGVGPGGSTFNVSTTQSTVTVDNLAFGDWAVTVDAVNIDSIVIARGVSSTTLHTGEMAVLNIPVTPLDGYGIIDLELLWNSADVEVPSISSQLVLGSGTTLNLGFTLNGDGSANYSSTMIPTGYHSLILQLLDNGTVVMGALEIVRMVKDQTTSGTFEFTNINTPGGVLEVNITPELNDPIVVSLSGQVDTLFPGETMTVTASVPPGTGTVVYAWYLNGSSVAVGQSYTLGGGLPAGFYRLDVTAFTADGKRAGSTTHQFSVEEGIQASLIWDPNSEPDIAGYRLHCGLASGQYSRIIDVGNRTRFTITGLNPGRTYYIAATAYNMGGLASDYSEEVVFSGT